MAKDAGEGGLLLLVHAGKMAHVEARERCRAAYEPPHVVSVGRLPAMALLIVLE